MRLVGYGANVAEQQDLREKGRQMARALLADARAKRIAAKDAVLQARLALQIRRLEQELKKPVVDLSAVQTIGVSLGELPKYQDLYRPVIRPVVKVQYVAPQVQPITRVQMSKPPGRRPRRPKRPLAIPTGLRPSQVPVVVVPPRGYAHAQLLNLLKQWKLGVALAKAERLALLEYLRLLRERSEILAELRQREASLQSQAAQGASSATEIPKEPVMGISLEEALATGQAWLSGQQISELEDLEDDLADEAQAKGEVTPQGDPVAPGMSPFLKGALVAAAIGGGVLLIKK